jgi:hypothetical protein
MQNRRISADARVALASAWSGLIIGSGTSPRVCAGRVGASDGVGASWVGRGDLTEC